MAVKNDIENIIGLCDGLMQKIDYSERYCWKNNKEKIMQQESINLDNGSLENYLTMHALVNKKQTNYRGAHFISRVCQKLFEVCRFQAKGVHLYQNVSSLPSKAYEKAIQPYKS